MSLSEAELERYARHIVLREIGGPGQRRLGAARALVVGAGGLGAPALLYLAAAGFGHIGVVDDDAVSLSNLQRQVLFETGDVGRPKSAAAAEALGRLNPHVRVVTHAARLDADNAAGLIGGHDLVLDGCDNFATRYAVNAAAAAAATPLVSGALSQWEGQVSVFDPARGAPCYACVFPEPPAPGLAPSCAVAGVVGALPGVIGAMMAMEAIKIVTGAGAPLRGRMLIYDALGAEARRIAIRPRPGCAVCGGGAA